MGDFNASKGLYANLPTSESHIRLLQIHEISPADEDKHPWDVQIECTMKTVAFTPDLSYRCLSYVWGNPEPHTILVNGHQLTISKNLFGFMRRMRAGSSDPNGYLWIDAICINQQNIPERTSQVRRMDDIYANASAVIAWLGWEWDRLGDASDNGRNEFAPQRAGGPHTEIGSEDAVQMVRDLASAFRGWVEKGGRPWDGELAKYAWDAREVYDLLKIEPQSSMAWRGLAVLLDRAWFRRAWIVQEAVLAKKLIIVVGREVLLWDDIVQVAIFLQASGWYLGIMSRMQPKDLALPTGFRPLLFANLNAVCRLEKVPEILGDKVKLPTEVLQSLPPHKVSKAEAFGILSRTIISARPFGATDARDKVFAPLLLARHTLAQFSPEFPQPDYSVLAQSVYNEVTSAMLEHSDDLYLLSQVEDRSVRRLRGLMSWSPDYSLEYHNPLVEVPGLDFDCLLGREKQCLIDRRVGSVGLEGCHFDDVNVFFGSDGSTLEDMYLSHDYRPLLQFCLDSMGPQYAGQDRVEALWQTLTGDCAPMSASNFKRHIELTTAIARYGDVQKEHITQETDWGAWEGFDQLHDTSSEARGAIPSTLELSDFAEDWRRMMTGGQAGLTETKTVAGPMYVFSVATGQVYGRRRLALTSRGVLCLVPASAARGDKIWFLSGAKVPFVLRPVGGAEGGFNLVGEAYVHGYMRGAIYEGEPGFETVVLR